VSPYLQEQTTFISQMEVYGQARQTIEKLLRVEISTSQVYRITDTYGELIEEELKQDIPQMSIAKDEVVYAQVDGGMIFTDDGWQEVKVGRIFRQEDIEKQSQGTKRQKITKSQYAAHLGHYSGFVQTFDRGLKNYKALGKRLVFINDGATWIDNWIKANYPKARSILDYYHVTEHLSKIGKLLIKEEAKFRNWFDRNRGWLLESKLDQVINSVRTLKANTVEQVDAKYTEIRYLTKNKNRMNYRLYRRLGLQIGSGAIEAAHRSVVQERMKKSGQRWSNEGARKMLNLRVCFKSQRWQLIISQVNCIAA